MTDAKVYASHADKMLDRRYREQEGFHPVVTGSMVLGERYDDMVLSPVARKELYEAAALIRWYQQFLCRIDCRYTEITDMTAIDLIRSV